MANSVTLRNKSGSLSFQLYRKTIIIFTSLALFSLLFIIVSLSIGSSFIHPLAVAKEIVGVGSGENAFIINSLRLPRVILAFMVGMALAVSGLILQAIIRNPLASPDIIGITGGASVGAILFIAFLMGTISLKWISLATFIGAATVSGLIYILSWKKGVTPFRLILIGIGVAAGMNAIVTMMIVLSETAVTTKAYLWLTGSVYGANWEDVYMMLPWILIFIPLTFLFARTVNVKELGDDIALGVGIRVQLHRLLLLIISVALAGSAVAFAGGIGFIGLIAPHLARMLNGRSFAGLIPIAALIGGSLVVMADLVARTAFLPLDLPAGVFTSGIGAPFFIYLLYSNRNM